MADIPLPTEQLATTEAPQQRVGGSIFQSQPSVGIGSGLQALGDGVDAIATAAATEQGRKDGAALERDADGVPHVANDQSHFIFGNAGHAYQHAMSVGALADVHNDAAVKMNDLRNQFPGDPQSFAIAAGKYADGVRSGLGGALGEAAFNHAKQLGSQYYVGLVNEKKDADVANSQQAILVHISDLKAEIGNIARGTSADDTKFLDSLTTPAGAKMAELKGYSQALADNPLFKGTWSQEKIDSQLQQFRQEAVNQWVIGNAQRVRDAQGMDAAKAWVAKNTVGSDSNMPIGEREAARAQGYAQIESLRDDQRARLQGSYAATAAFAQRYTEGVNPPTEEDFQKVMAAARASFDVAGAMKLQAFHDAYAVAKPWAATGPAAASAALVGTPAGSQSFSQSNMESWLDRVKKIENPGGNPAAVSPTGARGDFQFTSGTWARFGSGNINDPTDNRNAARRLAFSNAESLQNSLGRTPTEGELYLAHQQGPAGATALLQNPSANVVDALAPAYSGDRAKAAEAIRGNGGKTDMTAGQFASMWTNKFAGVSASPSSPIPFSGEQLKANPWLASAAATQFMADRPRQIQFARDQAELIGRSISMGAAPPVESVAQVLQIAAQNSQELGGVATKLRAQVEAAPVAMAAAGAPDGGAAYIQRAEDMARQSPDLYHMEFAGALKSQIDGRMKAFNDNPQAYAARSDVGWIKQPPVPLDAVGAPQSVGASDPTQVLQAGIAQRREAAFQIAARTGRAPLTEMFTQNDGKDIANLLQKGDGASADMLLRGLSAQLHPDEMQALASNKDFTNAVAGLTRSDDPRKAAVGYGFLDKLYGDNLDAFEKDYPGMKARVANWQENLAYKSQDEQIASLRKADTPEAERAREGLRQQADHETKDTTPAQVLGKVAGWTIPFNGPGAPEAGPSEVGSSGAGMLADYRARVRDYRSQGLTQGQADEAATKDLRSVWGQSDVNGGRMMRYAPEMQPQYQPIDGKMDWFKGQLAQFVDSNVKMMTSDPAVAQKLSRADHILVSDGATQADKASNRPPSYQVIVKDDKGQYFTMPERFRANRDAAQQQTIEREMIMRRQSYLGGGGGSEVPVVGALAEAWRNRPSNSMVQPPPLPPSGQIEIAGQ